MRKEVRSSHNQPIETSKQQNKTKVYMPYTGDQLTDKIKLGDNIGVEAESLQKNIQDKIKQQFKSCKSSEKNPQKPEEESHMKTTRHTTLKRINT